MPWGVAGRARGVALISVLWILAFLTVVAAGLSVQARTDARMTRTMVDVARARAATEGAVDLLVWELLHGSGDGDPRPVDGRVGVLEVAGTGVEVAVFDERGRIDLNKASAPLLDALFAAVGVDDAVRGPLVDAVLDWRDPDSLRRIAGAEDDEYARADRAYGAKDRPFDSVEELRLVLGMSPDIYVRVWPAVTVFSPQSDVDPGRAPASVLQALRGGRALPEPGSGDLALDPGDAGSGGAAGPRRGTFTILARARLPGGAARLAATVEIRQGPLDRAVSVLDWRLEPKGLGRYFDTSGVDEAASGPARGGS
jgi:general secretion pathway protein K